MAIAEEEKETKEIERSEAKSEHMKEKEQKREK